MRRAIWAATAVVAMIGSANAADLGSRPIYKAPPAQVVAYNWSGVYVGGHVGWGWQDGDATLTAASGGFPAGTVLSSRSNGFLGGAQVGVNWQTSNWVLGLEGDFSWSDAHGTATATIGPATSTGTVDYNWFATATGRVGYAMNDWLFYVKGGAAFVNLDTGGSVAVGGATLATVNSQSDTRTGWTVGAGIEHGIFGNWSWKAEYDYMDFGTKTVSATTTPATTITTTDQKLVAHAVKVGLNYRFGGM